MLKQGDVLYAIHERNAISRVRFERYTKRGTAAHVSNEDDNDKALLLALWRLYVTKEEAEADLQAQRQRRAQASKQRGSFTDMLSKSTRSKSKQNVYDAATINRFFKMQRSGSVFYTTCRFFFVFWIL